jgi:hypothetical protein
MRVATEQVVEIKAFSSDGAEYRVVEHPSERSFSVVRVAEDEPLELLAECPYTYNRETVRARAIRVAQIFREEE